MTLQETFRSASDIERASFFEFVIRELAIQFCELGSVALDIGAGGGSHTWAIAKAVGERGCVHAFEPNPTNAAFVDNLRTTYPWLQLHRIALADRTGEAPFFLAADAGMGALSERPHMAQVGYDMGVKGTITVETSRLDDVASVQSESRRIAFVKCDVEGAELAVFEGGKATLARHRPLILVELDENIAARSERAARGLLPDPVDWAADMRNVYASLTHVAGGSVVYDFFGQPLVEHVSGQNWCVAIAPVSLHQDVVAGALADAASRFWLHYRHWRFT